MIVFYLSMPGKASWNGKWSGEGRLYARVRYENAVPRALWGKSFFYRWDDGWEACVSVERMPASEANKIKKASVGFFGYDWMISSILKYGEIIDPADEGTPKAEALQKAFKELIAEK